MSQKPAKKDDLVHPIARPFLWLESKWLASSVVWVLGLVVVALGAVDFFHPRHEYLDFAQTPGFYVLAGFISFVAAVMGGWFVIRQFLGRAENYWDGEAGDE
ncbi:hypothetical protein [Maricaulis salignorans]|uniref:Uncharacterized protein n=1 Tax=Maricaulis salignorans TaxID=144026 RepID=A0A1G9Q530_9PROT|nr:hypothetical protein [Maricaulis salignorans]SDM06130.1 hypothetical protein SAMN04488568_104168 [Maricaulis salignorans]